MINLNNEYIKEYIPDNDFVYRRASYENYNQKTGKFTASAFRIQYIKFNKKNINCFSVDWSRYSTPEITSIDPRYNKKYCVGEFKASIPRKVDLDVNHTPNKNHKSHCTISTEKLLDEEDKFRLQEFIAENCIPKYFPNDTIKY